MLCSTALASKGPCQERHFSKQPNPTDSFARVLLFLWDGMREEPHSKSESWALVSRPRVWFHRPPKGRHHSCCESWDKLTWCCWGRVCSTQKRSSPTSSALSFSLVKHGFALIQQAKPLLNASASSCGSGDTQAKNSSGDSFLLGYSVL